MTKAQSKAALSATIDAKVLRAALKSVQSVVEARNTIPILSNVVLTFTRDQLALLGTDLDVHVERVVPAEAADPFAITLEAATLGRLVDKLPADAQVRIAYEAGKAMVTSGRSRFSLPTLPVDDFPVAKDADWQAEFELQAIYLERALARVAHAMASEEARYYLNGVFAHLVEGEAAMRFAATDGHRLARITLDQPDGAAGAPDVILPRKSARILAGLLAGFEGRVEVAVAKTKLRFVVGETTLTTKTIDGTFPDYSRVIPTGNDKVVKFERAALAEAVARVTTVSSDKTRAVAVELERDRLILSVASPEHGTAMDEVPCDYAGGHLKIGFNSRFLLDTLGQLADDTIEMHCADSAGPVLFRDREDAPALFVIMPMRV